MFATEVTEQVQRFVRPDQASFMGITAEYHRWFDEGDYPRARPLDAAELIALYMNDEGMSYEAAEREVSLNSHAKHGDRIIWELLFRGDLLMFPAVLDAVCEPA